MKKLLLCLLFFYAFVCFAAAPQRRIVAEGKVEPLRRIVICKANNTPLVNYAAKELQNFLQQATGLKIATGFRSDAASFNIILGDGELSRQAGLDVKNVPDEGFIIRRKGNQLFILGADSPDRAPNPKHHVNVEYPRGTLTGVYDFLERFAGVRFYFPGEFGTIVPKKDALYLPEKIDILDFPDMYFRRFSLYLNRKCGYGPYDVRTLRQIQLPRLRESEKRYNFGHGLNGLEYLRRFGKTHPEYFALRPDGKRYNDPFMHQTGQLCFSSGIREEIFQDAKAYFTGKPASSRGMKRWSAQTACDGIFGIMPQDGMIWCRCPACAKIWKGKEAHPDSKHEPAISAFMFRFFAEISERLSKEGIPHKLATMAYFPYRTPVDFKLPDELCIQVAVNGRGDESAEARRDTALLKAWCEKSGRKVCAWTYTMGKHNAKTFPGVPPMMPRHAAKFLKDNQKYLAGVYFESETDNFLFSYLNYHIIMKLMWNNSLDAEKLLSEHFTLMFGKAAPLMAKFYADLEKIWTEKILGNTVETPLGPVSQVPLEREVWMKIFTPAKIAGYNRLFDRAQKAVQQDKQALARLKFLRKEFLGAIEKAAKYYHDLQQGLDLWIACCPGNIWLRPYKGEFCEVNTKVSLRREKECLIVRCDCEEPRMKELQSEAAGRDDTRIFRDSVFEVLLNPSGDRENYFHFLVNANGALSDCRWVAGGKPDFSWNSCATAKGSRKADSWQAEISIPLSDLGAIKGGEFPVNFARNRVLKSKNKNNDYYMWSLYAGTYNLGFHSIKTWGKLRFGKKPESLTPNGNFEQIDPKTKRAAHWGYWNKPGAIISHDERCFVSGGRSIKIETDGTRYNGISMKVPQLKAGHKYRLSFYLKTEKLEGKHGAGAYICFNQNDGRPYPVLKVKGTNPWHRICEEFTAPAGTGAKGYVPVLMLRVWDAKGTAWFDEVHLEECK